MMLNTLKSRHARRVKLMLDIDEMLQFLVNNPDRNFSRVRVNRHSAP
jgi:hypothetical protein